MSKIKTAKTAFAVNIVSLQRACQMLMLLTLSFILLTLTGCSKRYDDVPTFWPIDFGDTENRSVGRFKTSYLAEQIDEYYRGTNPGPIGITTFVNLDDLYTTSSFGRMLGEQMVSELAMRGFEVVELRHSDALQFMNTSGEFALSRDISSIKRERQLGGVIVGTYVVSPVRVYLNTRLIDPTSSMVLSAGSVEMEKTKEIARLVRGGGIAPALERIPVKHLGYTSVPMISANQARAWELEESSVPTAEMPNNKGAVSKMEKPIGPKIEVH